MVARDPNEAIVRFVELLRSTARCVTQVPLTALPSASGAYQIVFHPGRPALLRATQGTPDLRLSIVHHCQPAPHPVEAGVFTVWSSYYAYEILDLEEREILTYHWHPAGQSHVTNPHLHLSPKIGAIDVASTGQSPGQLRLADMHIATGRVLLEDVVRLLITEFNILPLSAAWETTLFDNAETLRAIGTQVALLARSQPADL